MIKVYGTKSCLFCAQSTQLLDQYQLEYEFIDIQESLEGKTDFLKRFPGVNIIPQIVWHNNPIGTYADLASTIENTLGGYGESKV